MGKKIVVVGGVAGGASFAARMRRLDETAEIILFEKGEYISFANCGLPYHIGETIPERDALIVQTPESFSARFGVDIRTGSTVLGVNPEKKEIQISRPDGEYTESYEYLLLSPGASPIRPPLPGIDLDGIHTLRTIPDMDAIKAQVDEQNVQNAVVIGGGFIGLETAENLRHRGVSVSLVELRDQVFVPADQELAHVLHEHLRLHGIKLFLEDGAQEFREDGDALSVVLQSGTTLQADMVILAIGVKPDTAFLEDSGIERSKTGAVVVTKTMQTNYDNIFAVGDAVEVREFISKKAVSIPLAGPANRQGRIAADCIAGIKSTYKDTQGTSVCKIFDLTAAVTGVNEKNARAWGIPFTKIYTHSANHASYYPGAYQMSVKTLFDPATGKIIGAQIVGKEGVDKRIDVFSVAIRHGLTVDDLAELELAYAPPYGSAKDPVNMAGFVAQNYRAGLSDLMYAEEVHHAVNQGSILLDVRTLEEYELGSIDGALHVPLDELRTRRHELDSTRPIIVFCQVGLRGHVASRILSQAGFSVKNLSGGYKTYQWYYGMGVDAAYEEPFSQGSCSAPDHDPQEKKPDVSIDAGGIQCPGPVMKLRDALASLSPGQIVEIRATESGFVKDLPAWCSRTGHRLVSLTNEAGAFLARVEKGDGGGATLPMLVGIKNHGYFSNDFDRLMASFIIANGAVSMGSEVTLFFTFWGLTLLRKDSKEKIEKKGMEKMFSAMMPRGAKKMRLSKMNMGGIGTALMRREMTKKQVFSLEQLIEQARENGVKMVACAMSMDIMGIKKEELIEGIEFGGVASYLKEADESSYNLFI
ncbi:FAD-dependent oxidoreductase [Chitinivibrio alkaliphilus]|uniref:Pyridine nucleotide-disulfide oxidoreductase family protein n=1 Tax=Chitinivibrio alkaliphilus ACht1 TaxID=1313304 RepID=U7D8D0_9BACT|nr:FAD-dependent oxidoreductase [Chitinivibrio alkaliphilus]ERP31322.1 pyridine nucleotide-disulfide oxidoreductase family protein [Chitinivibrio alkaliphilus ACht1]